MKLTLGIERIDEYLNIFEGKRVGLITNHTGLTNDLKSSIDVLNSKVDLVCLFAPEHGVRGNIQAGDKLESYVDPDTGLPVHSLYGASRRPSKEMMDSIDVLCYDIQDVGARCYTYIYTMAYAMSAASEYGKEFVVFDRPNPLGSKIEGNILNLENRSFVGYYPILQRYGLTIGELASLFNKEYDINCYLRIIPLKGYERDFKASEYPIKWILPSPNIPTFESSYYYQSTVYFEGTNVSEGRGTAEPFKVFGAPWFNSRKFIEEIKKIGLKHVEFREAYFTPSFSKHKDELCHGVELFITDFDNYEPVKVGLTIIWLACRLHDEFKFLDPYREGGKNMIDYLVGDSFIRLKNLSLEEIYQKLEKDTDEFSKIQRKYHIYG